MMRRLKTIFISLALLLCLLPAVPVAAEYKPFDQACKNNPAIQNTPPCLADGTDPLTGKSGILYKVSRIIALIAGVCAVLIMMFGGFTYVTANGDASKAKNGRSMIIGAAVGLVVIALAETLLSFVINAVS